MFIASKELLKTANPSTALLILAWKEMFNPLTPDTFQPRLLNVPLLVRELGDMASRTKAVPKRWQQHLSWVQEELKASVSSESHFLQKQRYYASSCQHLAAMSNPLEIERLC